MTENRTSSALEDMRVKFCNVIVGIQEISDKYKRMEKALQVISRDGKTEDGEQKMFTSPAQIAHAALSYDPLHV